MKCPICDKEHDTLLCPACGFDASHDYAQYPTFGPVGPVQSAAARRRERYQRDQEKVEQISALLASLLAVRYLKLIEEDPYVRAANLRLQALSAELSREKAAAKQVQNLNQELGANLALSMLNTENAADEQKRLEAELRAQIRSNIALKKQVSELENRLEQSERWRAASSRDNGAKVLQIRELEKTISDLKAELATEEKTISDLKVELAAERNKGVLERLFNR